MRDTELTRPLAKKASEILMKYLGSKTSNGGEQIRIALASLQTHVKMCATEAINDGNKLSLAKMIYSDPKLREQYIKKTMPYMIENNKQTTDK